MGEWQPIETAPKDGRWVLCWGHNAGVVESMIWHWNDDSKDGNWYWYEGDCPRTQPTHWMPMPAPPVSP